MNIQPHELRLGNWIYDGDMEPMKIESLETDRFAEWNNNGTPEIHLSSPTDDHNMFGSEHLNGIPITAEILKKSGFEREERKDWGHDKFYVWYQNGVDIHEGNEPTDFMYATYVKGSERSFKAGRNVLFVHQLQNLYFALTGTELEVQL